MAITRPSAAQVRELAASLYMSMSHEEAAAYRALMDASFDAYDVVDALPDHIPPVKYPRTPGTRPSPDENPLGAWYWKSEVKGAETGKLQAKTVALKDNVALAGVPMMNGASTLEGFVPASDATIVTRMLDAGATILGKAVCEHFCLSGGSHTSDPGRSTTRTGWATRPAARPPAAAPWWPPARSIWRSAAIRAGRSASPPRIAGSTA